MAIGNGPTRSQSTFLCSSACRVVFAVYRTVHPVVMQGHKLPTRLDPNTAVSPSHV